MGSNWCSMGLMGDTHAMGLNGFRPMGGQWVTAGPSNGTKWVLPNSPMGLNGTPPTGPNGP
ncbi:hypothetical protein HOLleu_21183 [Holothuria leucospilota]|uniref:Uncharacterized protein n=1 Tax=Holothuria leucospilota TaxID=206669 RepID=A0A9Q1H6B2_HOLLE|nr:hypothetical protein HOLleu_21183 [Holothuria leucospilota]